MLLKSGPHVKQICGKCGSYIKFYDKGLIPDLREIKLRILYLANGDLSEIENAKLQIGFMVDNHPLWIKLQYWKLLLHFSFNPLI